MREPVIVGYILFGLALAPPAFLFGLFGIGVFRAICDLIRERRDRNPVIDSLYGKKIH